MASHYHDAFWIINGTASPVIALANAVSIGRSVPIASKISSMRKQTGVFPISNFCANGSAVASAASLIVCVVLMGNCAAALLGESDPGNISLFGIALVGALALLVPQVLFDL